MTRFIIFRDVVLNADEIQYVIIREEKKKNTVEYIANVCYKNGDGVSYPYSTEENAKRAIAEIYKLLNPPALFADEGTINVPPGTDPATLPMTITTAPPNIGQL